MIFPFLWVHILSFHKFDLNTLSPVVLKTVILVTLLYLFSFLNNIYVKRLCSYFKIWKSHISIVKEVSHYTSKNNTVICDFPIWNVHAIGLFRNKCHCAELSSLREVQQHCFNICPDRKWVFGSTFTQFIHSYKESVSWLFVKALGLAYSSWTGTSS